MRFFPVVACLGCALTSASMQAAIPLPILHLDPKTLNAFNAYVARFEKEVVDPYVGSGKLWMDSVSCCVRGPNFPSVKPAIESRENADFEKGSIHHYTGALHVPRGTIEDIRQIMEDYPNYPQYFKPDVTKARGGLEPDSTRNDEHFVSHMTLAETTLGITAAFDCTYDTHYIRINGARWHSKSYSASIKELREGKDPNRGYYPEGEDHGFVWRTNTYWFARERNGGLDLELDSVSLSRPNPTGLGWYGGKRSHDAVDKMLRDTKAAIEALHR